MGYDPGPYHPRIQILCIEHGIGLCVYIYIYIYRPYTYTYVYIYTPDLFIHIYHVCIYRVQSFFQGSGQDEPIQRRPLHLLEHQRQLAVVRRDEGAVENHLPISQWPELGPIYIYIYTHTYIFQSRSYISIYKCKYKYVYTYTHI